MGKRCIRGWKKKIFSLVLALAIMLEPPMISIAANDQAVSEENVAEESKAAEESEAEEGGTEPVEGSEAKEESEPAEGTEAGEESEPAEGSEAKEESEPAEGTEAKEESEPADESEPAEESEAAEEAETAETEEESSKEEAEEPKLTAEDSIAGDLVYAASTEADFVVSDGVLTSYTGAATEVIIPDGVTKIAAYVFKNNTTMESVTCPDSLKSIGEYAFSGCTGLREVKLNEGLTSIGKAAFEGAGFGGKTETQATANGTLTIPGTVSEIGAYAFKNSAYLGEVIFENGATEGISYIYDYSAQNMFEGCTSLKKVTLPDRATEIPNGAFLGCTALEEVSPGAKIEIIGANAFKKCSALKKIECPDSLKSIGEYAFSGCAGLREVKLNEGLTSIGKAAFEGAGFGGKTETQKIERGILTIPSTVSEIGAYAFKNSAYLGEVIFENGATEGISYVYDYSAQNMFEGCTSLKKVTLPDRATEIPDSAFYGCTALEEVSLGANVETIGANAFKNCSALKKIECPDSLKSIGEYAFSGCAGLREVKLNEGLTSIGKAAFEGAGFGGKTETQATVYGTLTIPGTVFEIGAYAFRNSAYLGEVVFENGATEGISYVYYYSMQNMFEGCTSLKKVTLPDRATEIPDSAFYGCTALEEVSLGANVETIGANAFKNCSALKKIECPDSLKSIGENAFSGCAGLMDVQLNEGLGTIGANAFEGAGFGGKTETQATVYGTLTIPSTVYSIGAYAFAGCAYLGEVVFPNGRIEALLFDTRYGYVKTFQECKNLKRVYLPERLSELPTDVFNGCSSLDTLYIPKNVETISENAVRNCDFKKLVIYGEPDSAAQTFANKLGIRFENKTELGLYAKSVRLNRSEISFAGEGAIGRQVTLKAAVLPSTAQNKAVVYTSNDERVATVDANGVVSIVGYGETDIVVAALENENITASCHVKILKQWTEEELNEIRQFIEEHNNLTLVSNVYSNLQDFAITGPDGIKAAWKASYELETGPNKYDVSLEKDGYQSTILKGITVNGITVTGVEVDSTSVIQQGKSYPASVTLLTQGGKLDKDDYQIEWRSANTGNVTVTQSTDNPLEATITGSKVSKSTNVVAKVVLNRDGKAVSVTNADQGKTWFEGTFKVAVSDSAVVDEITVTAMQDQSSVELGSLGELVNLPDNAVYELKASASSFGETLSDVAFTWKSSNAKVAKIAADKSGKVTLTVLGKGTSVITVTAAKNGGYSTSFRVTVKDSMPRLVEKTVTLNRYLTNVAGYITLIPSDGYEIAPDSLNVVDAKSGNATAFKVYPVEGNKYAVGVKEGESVAKGAYSVKILAKTTANEEVSHELPLKVSVVQAAPKVTIKQTAINLYERDGRGVVQIVTDAEISSIRYTPGATLGNARLVQDEADTHEGILYVKAENARSDNYTKTANKGTIAITFDGYTQEASYEKTITLAVNKKLPTIKAVPGSATLYPETLADTTEIVLHNKTADEAVLSQNGYTIAVTSLNNYKYTGDDSEAFPVIQAQKGARAGVLKYTVTNSNWLDGVKVTAKCSFKIGKVPALSFATGKITLNAAYNTGIYDAVSVDAYVKGFENIVFDDSKTQIAGKDEKSRAALDDGAVELYLEDGAIKAGVADSGYFAKAGSYTYIVTAYSENNMPVTGTLKLSVVPAKSKASIRFKTAGSINLLDRENTYVTATAALKNYTGTVKEAELYGVNAGKFDAEVVNGKIMIRAQCGRYLKANSTYKLGVIVTLDSGVSFDTQISITPKQKNPRLTQSTKSVVLFESAKGTAYGDKITVDVAAGQAGRIKDIKPASASDTFGYEAGENGTGIIYVKDTASLNPGKSYTLKLAVTFDDAASNGNPAYVSVKVVYCK